MSRRIKVTILGGSALATPKLFEFLSKAGAQAAYDFVLYGRNQERLGLVKSVSESILSQTPALDVQISTSTAFEPALEGVDYCINQIRVGGLKGRAMDETFPRQFGIPGEETVGPGGFNNSLRGIPVVLDLCRKMETLAPEVTLLNLTNPSSIIHYAIRRYTSVDVIGTCDSPVSLMESIARLLGVPVEELQFDLAGMHHFGWIAAVKQDGKERLPEVLDRLEEMPKLGTDPEVVRAIGAIPATYLKYYFHPDRILAASEGRTIRAHQLMVLADQMLEDFRRWKPGPAPQTLNQRGAVWYDKIVGPTLLALAEKGNTELVLSVDNAGSLPWLPDEAIVEVPVPIRDGKLQQPRRASLPQDVQSMLARNCAYEMLAAQAIVENDRDKAIRALLANLMVSNFNQVRGILSLIWPGEKTHQFESASSKQEQDGQQEEETALKKPSLYYGPDLIESLDPHEETYVLVTMREPWEAARARFTRQPYQVIFVQELDWYALEALERAIPDVEAVVAMGGGTAIDAAKYVAWRRHLPVDAIASITSVDASVTKSIAARAGGHVTYIGYIVPRNVYVDYRLIQSAPAGLNRSGIGDIVCAHVALWDWKLAHDHKGETYDTQAAASVQAWIDCVAENAMEIRQVSEKGIRTVMEAFEDISLICRRFGSSRPQEASDHTFAYNVEFQTGKNFLHGELVALGSYVMAVLQDNDPQRLLDIYEKSGLRWQPAEIGLTRSEFVTTLETLNWYQKNFGRRYSILDERKIDETFIQTVSAQLRFED
jgi:6-phospho-beta-glucosidase